MPSLHVFADGIHGRGHISRGQGLIDAWLELDYGPAVFVDAPEDGDILYSEWQGSEHKNIYKHSYDYTVVAHNGLSGAVYADMSVIYEHSLHSPLKVSHNYAPEQIEGLEYFPLQKQWWGQKWGFRNGYVGIAPGSAESMNVEKIVHYLKSWGNDVVMLQNMSTEDFIKQALRCSFVITSASTTAVELISCGMAVNVVLTHWDQVVLYNSLIAHGYARPFDFIEGHLRWDPMPEDLITQNGAFNLADAIYNGWKNK